MRRLALTLALVAPGLLAAGSAPVEAPRLTVEQSLAQAAAEARQAEARLAILQTRERAAKGEAARLAAAQRTAAAEIELAQSRLAASEAQLAQARARVALGQQQLDQRRAPLAALLAGLATMGRRPPILTLADGASVAEIIRVRALVDSTMPVIARRSAALQAEIGARRRLAEQAESARTRSAALRGELAERVARFAALEREALGRAETLGRDAFVEGDRVMAGGEAVLDLASGARAASEARAAGRALAAMPLSPPRPAPAEGTGPAAAIAYQLPTVAPVVTGLGEIDPSGVRSRGIRFATRRGVPIVAPASGTILFAGPYREHDGIIVIDHGSGWTSLLVAVAPGVERGARVSAGAPVGRALGDVTVELREKGVPRSAALIAGSSDLLSNGSRNR